MLVLLGVGLFYLGFRLVGAVCVLLGIWGETAEGRITDAQMKKAEYKKFVENTWLPWVSAHKDELSTLDYVRYRLGFMFYSLEEMNDIILRFGNEK